MWLLVVLQIFMNMAFIKCWSITRPSNIQYLWKLSRGNESWRLGLLYNNIHKFTSYARQQQSQWLLGRQNSERGCMLSKGGCRSLLNDYIFYTLIACSHITQVPVGCTQTVLSVKYTPSQKCIVKSSYSFSK